MALEDIAILHWRKAWRCWWSQTIPKRYSSSRIWNWSHIAEELRHLYWVSRSPLSILVRPYDWLLQQLELDHCRSRWQEVYYLSENLEGLSGANVEVLHDRVRTDIPEALGREECRSRSHCEWIHAETSGLPWQELVNDWWLEVEGSAIWWTRKGERESNTREDQGWAPGSVPSWKTWRWGPSQDWLGDQDQQAVQYELDSQESYGNTWIESQWGWNNDKDAQRARTQVRGRDSQS